MNLRDFDRMPPVGVAMTPFPRSVSANDTLDTVAGLMRSAGIRHVPVQQDGQVVGLVSEREVERTAAADAGAVKARDVMTRDVYQVDIRTPLHRVLDEMARRRLGSAVVLRNGRLAGIVSTSDVCRLLAEILEDRFSPGGDAA